MTDIKYIYLIQEWTHFGIIELAYFIDEKIAIQGFKNLVKQKIADAKKSGDFAKQADLDRNVKNGAIEKEENDPFFKNEKYIKMLSATVSVWYKSSYEYDEWDIGGSTFKLVKTEVTTNPSLLAS